ncbi:MAG TPA: DNA repair protein RadC [Alphaproteobacteria bacterium]|nr:DNA repair protein RadC [Alphaproteobacteria bacterium]
MAAELDDEKPHHLGHRDRLRQRFLSAPESLQDYELVELLLFMAIPRRDVKPLAKDLLKRFGSFPELMAAPVEELVKVNGVSDNTACALKAVAAASQRMVRREMEQRPILNNWDRLMDYCFSSMAFETREHFRILFMSKKNHLLADEIQGSGTVDHTPAYPREVVKRALELGATAMILVHNHPSGDPNPSQADVDMTQRIVQAAQPFGILVHDHVIVSRNGTLSMKERGFF